MYSSGKSPHALNIAICGIRGIPACYGGFETFAEELGKRLAERGHRVLVYGRDHVIKHSEPKYLGVDIKLLPAPRHKYLETPVHTWRCLKDIVRNPVDVVLVCNAANSPFVWLPRLRGIPVAVNVDGIERMRAKWNFLGRLWYRLGEICSVLFASEIISDAGVIESYYRETYHVRSRVIAYGHRSSERHFLAAKCCGENLLDPLDPLFTELKIQPDRYLLYVSRLEPENNAHRVIQAYSSLDEEVQRALPLVVVGDAPYAKEYIEELHRIASPSVVFAGYRFGDQYETLQRGAHVYIQATEVGGTHPALVEAMGFANCIIANGTPENQEVLSDCGEFYAKNNVDELKSVLTRLVTNPRLVNKLRRRALKRAQELYDWEIICSNYEDLFREMCSKKQKELQPSSTI
ncbi:MAG: DUF1972 domain-containing protein [Bdellovibrionota bacterium]